ncbi:MAG: class I SAM-dependent methyltransferase, partial [Thermogutta sp.]
MDEQARNAADVVLPILLELLPIQSVVDVGCGHGAWLSVASGHGITTVVGIDGPWVNPGELLIPTSRFIACDLTTTFVSCGKFDLAICLEVAEHLPALRARPLVQYLTSLAPAILFSAAIPGQGGTHHINEQWPEYWESLFNACGYVRLDPIRRHVWMNPQVAWYYQQNLFLYVDLHLFGKNPRILEEQRLVAECPLTLVHKKIIAENLSFRSQLRCLFKAFFRAISSRWARITS